MDIVTRVPYKAFDLVLLQDAYLQEETPPSALESIISAFKNINLSMSKYLLVKAMNRNNETLVMGININKITPTPPFTFFPLPQQNEGEEMVLMWRLPVVMKQRKKNANDRLINKSS